jgi:hypothetical protein
VPFFTAVIAVATVVYVFVSCGQLRALYQSNEGAQRAWVLPEETRKSTVRRIPIELNKPFEYEITIGNSGKSPAQHVATVQRWGFGPIGTPVGTPAPPDEHVLYGGQSRGVLASGLLEPGGQGGIIFGNIVLNDQQYSEFRNGTHVLYFFARITYADQFSPKRTTRFCFYVSAAAADRLGVCSVYNSAD